MYKKLIEKRLKVTRVKDLLTGKFDISREGFKHVKSIAIFSCQSPLNAFSGISVTPSGITTFFTFGYFARIEVSKLPLKSLR